MKFGRVVFIGEANVGKSSLLNALVGEHVSIVTDMPGTTREEVRGVLNGEGFQIVFLDTPGMGKSKTDLDRFMNKSISAAHAAADVIVYVIDAEDFRGCKKIGNFSKPVIIAVNKTDKTTFEKLYPKLKLLDAGTVAAIVPVSAKTGDNLDVLVAEIVKKIPEGEKQFEVDEYTDQPMRKMCAEIIRGELIKRLHKEVPHGLAVNIAKWQEGGRKVEISAQITVSKQNHKPIVIGSRGALLKEVGIASRKKIEALTEKHVRLETHVVVCEDWKNKRRALDELGYGSKTT